MCTVLYFLNIPRNISVTYISYNEGQKMFMLMHPAAHTSDDRTGTILLVFLMKSKSYMAKEVHIGHLHLLLPEEGKRNIDRTPSLGVPPEITHQSTAPSDSHQWHLPTPIE
jgi:hypothetical protein